MTPIPGKPFHVRVATAQDAATLARLRMALLQETGQALSATEHESLRAGNEAFFAQAQAEQWQSWLAEVANNPGAPVAAVGTLAFFHRPPYPGNALGLEAYLLNMYTVPSHRGQGAAIAVLNAAMACAQARGVRKLILHATQAGRPMYEKLGFRGSEAYMEWVS